ncbi:transposase [Geminicoccus sp.]|uniref:transposase n=1 Tax=Geminicoccus sp. TaxID=2024832 RepID=UPI0039C89633
MGQGGYRGCPASKQLMVRERMLVGLRSGSHWRELPEHCGPWKMVHRNLIRWCDDGA